MLIIVHDTSQGVNAHDTRFGTFCSCGFMSMLVRCRSHRAKELQAARTWCRLVYFDFARLDFEWGFAPYPTIRGARTSSCNPLWKPISLTRDSGSVLQRTYLVHLCFLTKMLIYSYLDKNAI